MTQTIRTSGVVVMLAVLACGTPKGIIVLDTQVATPFDNVVPSALVGSSLETDARACAIAYNESLRSGRRAAVSSGLFKGATAAGVAAAALASGMTGAVSSADAKRHWGYAALVSAAFVPLATGLDAWLNSSNNMVEQKSRAEAQLVNLVNAGFLMSCVTLSVAVGNKVGKAIVETQSVESDTARKLKDALAQFEAGGQVGKLVDQLDAAAASVNAQAKKDPAAAAQAAKAVEAIMDAKDSIVAPGTAGNGIPKLPAPASCLDAQGKGIKTKVVLLDEAQGNLVQCLGHPIWTLGAVPAAAQSAAGTAH